MPIEHSEERGGHYVAALRRRAWLLLVLFVLGGGAGVAAATVLPVTYTASATVLVTPLDGNPYSPQGRGDDLINLETEAQLVAADSVARLAERRAGGDLGGVVAVEVPVNTQVVEISYTASTPGSARTGAQTYADAYLEYRQQRAQAVVDGRVRGLQAQATRVEEDLRRASEQLAAAPPAEREFLSQQIIVYTNQLGVINEQLNDASSASVSPGQVITPPELPAGGRTTRIALLGLTGAVAALVGAGAAVLARDLLRRRIRYVEDVVRSGVRAVTDVPGPARSDGAPVVAAAPDGAAAEAFRRLRAELTAVTAPSATVVVCSPSPAAGPSTSADDLALSLARAGFPTVLVRTDGDGGPTAPPAHAGRGGLSEVLLHGADPRRGLVEVEPGLRVLPAGADAAGAAARIGGPRMSAVLQALRAEADYVVVAGPPLRTADGRALVSLSDGVLLVVQKGETLLQHVRDAVLESEKQGTVVLGAVLEPRRAAPARRPAGAPARPAPADEAPAAEDHAGTEATTRLTAVPASEPVRDEERPVRPVELPADGRATRSPSPAGSTAAREDGSPDRGSAGIAPDGWRPTPQPRSTTR